MVGIAGQAGQLDIPSAAVVTAQALAREASPL
jgi:hypothetical protein